MNDRAGSYVRARKTRDRALVLVVIGLLLLMPPVAGIFQVDGKLFSLPGTLIYLFAVWALLILGAVRLARALANSEDTEDTEGDRR